MNSDVSILQRSPLARWVRWVFSARGARCLLISLAWMLTLVALFYGEENWRGHRAWRQYRQELERGGARLDYQALWPRPVADEQNFATTPAVAAWFKDPYGPVSEKRWTDDFRAAGLRIPTSPYRTNTLDRRWFIDLAAWDQAFAAGRAGQLMPDQDFVSPRLDLASRAKAAPGVLAGLRSMEPLFEELRAASRRPYVRYPLNYAVEHPRAILCPHARDLDALSQRLELRICAELAASQADAALADLKLLLYLADSLKPDALMISQWVRVRLLQRALQPVWEGLAEGAWSPTQLAELTALWQSYRLLPDCAFTLDAERASTLWTIDCIRRSPEPEALIDSFEGLPPIEAYVGGTFLAGSLGRVLPGGWYAREKVGYSRLFQTVVRSGFDPGQERVWPKEITANAAEAQRQHLDARRSYLGALLRHEYAAAAFYSHDLERIVRRFCYTQAVIDQAIIACALESCRRAHGEYPGNLQALAPGFLARLPNDVLTGAPYQYRRTGGGFVLYSIGWDQQDDHGTVVLTKDGSLDLRKGDWVWEHPSN